MNFINDRITDEDRKRFDFTVFKTPIYSALPYYSEERLKMQKRISTPYFWTVDREARCFIITLGSPSSGMPDPDHLAEDVYFSLWWQEINIEFIAIKVPYDKNSLAWKGVWVAMPEHLKDKETEIYAVIEAALLTYQYDGDRFLLNFPDLVERRLDKVKVEFAKPNSNSE
jgi:hypothetical protein